MSENVTPIEEREKVGGLEPAASIITRLGGPKEVAAEIGIHRTRVSKWKLPKASGGTGGTIPQKHYPALMRFARKKGVDLRFAEFVQAPDAELDLDCFDVPAPPAPATPHVDEAEA